MQTLLFVVVIATHVLSYVLCFHLNAKQIAYYCRRMSSDVVVVDINDIFEELTEDNKRLSNQLMFSNKYIKTVDEFMTFVDLIFTRLKTLLSPNNYRSLCEPEAYHNYCYVISGFAKQLSRTVSTNEKNVNNVSNEVQSQASNDLPPKSPIIEIRSQTNESEVNTKITNHSKSCSQRKSAESVSRSQWWAREGV